MGRIGMLVLGYGLLPPVAAIVIGLLIFFKGRAHVRKKHDAK